MVCKRSIDEFFETKENEKTINDTRTIRDCEENLLKWLENSTNFHGKLHRNIIRNYLHGAKFNLERAKKKLTNYYTTKHQYPELYTDWDPYSKEISNIFNLVNIVAMPKLTENGERVIIFSLADPDAAKFNIIAISKLLLMLYQLVLTMEFQANGEILIFDGRNFTSNHLLKLVSTTLKNICTIFKDSYAVRIKEIHIINLHGLIEKTLLVVQPLCHEKIKKRFIIHKSHETLADYISKDVLPEDYGGDSTTIEDIKQKWQEIMKDNSEWLQQQEQIRAIKPSNKDNRETFENNISLNGSFRQLNID